MADPHKEFDNTNRGALFVNERKDKDSHPDRTGTLNVEGVDYWISGWIKKSAAGKQFMSISITKKEQQTERAERPKSTYNDDYDNNIPF